MVRVKAEVAGGGLTAGALQGGTLVHAQVAGLCSLVEVAQGLYWVRNLNSPKENISSHRDVRLS